MPKLGRRKRDKSKILLTIHTVYRNFKIGSEKYDSKHDILLNCKITDK